MIMVTYDLNQLGQEYQDLFEAIKSIGCPWWHHMKSVWLLDTRLTANEVYKQLESHLDKNDHILVIGVDPYEKQGWLPKKAWDWINNHRAA